VLLVFKYTLRCLCYPSQQPLPFPIRIIRGLLGKKMLCFSLFTVDHIRLYFILKIKAPNFLPQAASAHVLVWSFCLGGILNVATSSSSYTSRSPTLLVLLQLYTAGHSRDCILTSLNEIGHCYFSRWPKINPQNWKYCVFVPGIEISSKLTWRVLDWF